MTSIGIIANPASGKDIRRLVSHATVIDNYEKINIVERIVLGAQALGVKNIYMMPDSNNTGQKVIDNLSLSKELKCEINVIDMYKLNGIEDTLRAASYMESINVGCIVTLGGDGTNRAVAKVLNETPIITISTGTNNAYPVMIEGTVAGMAAAAVASKKYDSSLFIEKDKRIEIYKDNNLIDIALIDVVISKDAFVASKAIWDMEAIEKIFVSRCHPASIGFSSIVGCKKHITNEDDFGALVDVGVSSPNTLAAVAAGVITPLSVSEPTIISFEDKYEYIAKDEGTIALDGEREIEFFKGEKFVFKITRNGPLHVDIKKCLQVAQSKGFFNYKI